MEGSGVPDEEQIVPGGQWASSRSVGIGYWIVWVAGALLRVSPLKCVCESLERVLLAFKIEHALRLILSHL